MIKGIIATTALLLTGTLFADNVSLNNEQDIDNLKTAGVPHIKFKPVEVAGVPHIKFKATV